VMGILVTTFLGKFVAKANNRERAIMLDKIADSILAMIRLNNPGNVLLEKVQFYEDKLFDALLANSATTNNESVLRRVTASAISRAIVNDGAVLDEAVKSKPVRP